MSSSSTSAEPEPEVQPFPYLEAGVSAPGTGSQAYGYRLASRSAAAAGQASAEEKAREAGRQEGEARARAGFEQQLAQTRDLVRVALQEFATERASYYQRVEAEVVQLALSIARKILHREAQVDPLLLAGMVRVALGKIEAGTRTVIRIHPQHVAEWRAFFTKQMDPRQLPELVEDPALEGGRCVLQSSLGTTDLGIEVQLKEIERGLLDLLAQRPQAAP